MKRNFAQFENLLSGESLPEEWEHSIDSIFHKVKASLLKSLEEHKQQAKENLNSSLKNPFVQKKASEQLKSLESSERLNAMMNNIEDAFSGFLKSFKIESSFRSDEISEFSQHNLKVVKELPVQAVMGSKCIESIEKKQLVVLGDARGYLYTWKTDSLEKVQSIRAFPSWITCIKYSEANNYLFVGSAEGKFRVYQVTKHNKLNLVKSITVNGTVFGLLPIDHRDILLMSGMNMGVSIWNLKSVSFTGYLPTDGHSGVGHQLCHMKKYDMVAAGFATGQISIYDLESQTQYAGTSTGKTNWYINHLIFVEENNNLLAYVSQGKIGCWKFNYEERKLEMIRSIQFIDHNLRSLIPANDGRIILFNAGNRYIYGYDWRSEITFEVYKGNDLVSSFGSLPGNRILVSEHPSRCIILSCKS